MKAFPDYNVYIYLICSSIFICFSLNGCGNRLEDELYESPNVIQKVVEIDTILNTDIDYSAESDNERLPFVAKGNEVWIYVRSTLDSIYIKRFNLETHTSNIVSLTNPLHDQPTIAYLLPQAIQVSDKYFVVLIHRYLSVFSRMKDSLIHLYTKNIIEPFQILAIADTSLLLARSYNHNPKDALLPVKLSFFSIIQGKILSEINPSFDGIEFSHFFPYKWIDADSKLSTLLFSQTLRYHVKLYNNKLQTIGEITRHPKYWTSIDTNILSELHFKQRLPAREIIAKYRPVHKGVGSRLQHVQFIRDSIIIVSYKPFSKRAKEDRLTVCDIWQRDRGRWKLLFADLIDRQPRANAVYSKGTFPLLIAYDPPQITNNWMVSVKLSAPDSIMRQKNETYGQINTKQENFFMHNAPKFQLYVYKIKI